MIQTAIALRRALAVSAVLVLCAAGCHHTSHEIASAPAVAAPSIDGSSYRDDAAFLRSKTQVIELQRSDAARIAIAPVLQGRVMTSGVSEDGVSLGWVNREAVSAGDQDIAFNNYGGEERFWLAPEGGQFTLFHHKGDPQNYDTWRVPVGFNNGAFEVVQSDSSSAILRKQMIVKNAEGVAFDLKVDRTIRLVTRKAAEQLLKVRLPREISDVSFFSDNRITNTGETAWKPETGAVAIWILGMFPGRDRTVVIAPFVKRDTPPELNLAYYPDQPESRITINRDAGVLLFKTDGDCRSKFGLNAKWAKDRLGSIDFANRVLTVILFRRSGNDDRYVNCLMQPHQSDPYHGDVINSYNHYNGLRFYELESASPAAFLEPSQSMEHARWTLQFHGPLDALSKISRDVFGIDLELVQRWEESVHGKPCR